ncbi:putative disease resistance protein RGA3 [Triticum urartu]|uniref:putative disease resistance protein RGA3 n=1 Tax=Triticum urartu TaxID=4572 RepID=UPI0020433F06|nr:putative disease resistance protein RGA3 [Triticum urartu]
MLAALSAAQWVVGKALAPVADGLLEAWDASKRLGLNIEALRMELLLVQATLETASRKQIDGRAMEDLLGKLGRSAHSAEDLLDELDYFRIHDELHDMHDATDQHAKGCFHDLALNARHTAKAVLGLSACSRQRYHGNSSSTPSTNQVDEDGGCMLKLGKLLPCSYLPHVRDDHSGQPTHSGAPRRATPMPGFNRVDVSERMKRVIEQLQPVRTEVTKVLQSCGHMTVPDIAKTRPITTGQSIEPKLYGRDRIMNSIIHDMTKGKYRSKDLTVLPIVGPGGIGKTTLIQHIYRNQQVRNHFQVVIWVCVSLKFNLNKLLEEIETYEGEKYGRVEELIEQRLRSKRFLLVLDDVWEFSDEDDWKRLLLPLKTSQEKGSIILLTTRFPIIAKMVETTDHIELEGLESEQFRKLFLRFIFGDGPFKSDHNFLLDTGDKIMEKLKGSPLAAKTVGTLLRKCLNLRHWRRVLESKEWERRTGTNDIMPALKLSYDYLSFHQQQCFFYSALFPEDHEYSTTELINLWIGLDILQPSTQNQTLEDVGLMNLNDLVTHGFFKEEETNGRVRYVMHDLLHDLALKVGSHECLTVHHSNVGSVEIKPSIRHLSIIIDDDHTMSGESFKSQLRKLKTRLKVKELHTLMLFGEMDESFAQILDYLFKEANALRFIRLVDMPSFAGSTLPNNSALVHLRYLCLGTKYTREIPLAISKFYHLRILDLGWWHGCCDLPKDLSNLAKLRRFYTPSDELHSHIYNVGKLTLLEELKVFKVNKESEGFEPEQLEHLTELRELGMYNLENIHTKEEATKAKLIEKNYLERLTLDWDTERSNSEPDVEEVVLESLQPHRYLQELSIRGHGGPSCPTWLGDKLTVEALQSLHLVGVSWQCLPSFGKMWDLQELQIENCPEFLSVAHIPWTETLHSVKIRGVNLLEKLEYSKSSYRVGLEIVGKGDRQMLDQVLAFNNLTGLEQLMLSAGSFSSPCCFLFPPSLQYLIISGVEGMGTLETLSNLTSLTRLVLENCGEDQSCKGLGPLLAAGGQLRELLVYGSPRFFVGWDPNPRRVLQDGGGEGHELLASSPNSSKLQELCTDEAMGLLAAPICSFLSSSLARLHLYGNQKMKCFTKEQEGALHLLASLQELEFSMFDKLQSLPAGLHKLTGLKRLEVRSCPCVRSLPEDGLPESLQQLDVWLCNNEELKQQCRGLAGTIPKIN